MSMESPCTRQKKIFPMDEQHLSNISKEGYWAIMGAIGEMPNVINDFSRWEPKKERIPFPRQHILSQYIVRKPDISCNILRNMTPSPSVLPFISGKVPKTFFYRQLYSMFNIVKEQIGHKMGS
jgi:hypothetical protein